LSDLQIPGGQIDPLLTPARADLAGLARRVGAAAASDKAAVKKVAKDFESILLYKLMEEMQKTVPDSGLLSSGISKQVQGIFWYYLAQEVADGGGIGLWKEIYRHATESQPDGPAPMLEQEI